ncbi:MAG: hypothetical protein AMXMBFR47_21020 [Planctomycetota bacterium]
MAGVEWEATSAHEDGTWLRPQNSAAFGEFTPLGVRARFKTQSPNGPNAIFDAFSLGVTTARDNVVYDFNSEPLINRIREFIEAYNSEVDRYRRTGNEQPIDDFVTYDSIKWSRDLKLDVARGKYAEYREDKLRRSLFRPFCKQMLFYDRILNEEARSFDVIVPTKTAESENAMICVPNAGGRTPYWAIATNCISHYALSSLDATQCFPFYVYDEDGTNRRDNITDWALKQFRDHYKDKKIDKWAIFHYVYGLLHHGGYREKFADNLKRELPRIPFAPDFWAFSKAGKKLAGLHLDYESLEPWPLKWVETAGEPLSYRVDDKMRLSKDKSALVVNKSLTLEGIPTDVYEYRLGNRSALEWVVDQYQVYTDPRSGITSDPNRADDPEYIVRLVGQVVRVSIETVKIVRGLPEEYSEKLPDHASAPA